MSKRKEKKGSKNKSRSVQELAWTFHPLRSNIRHAAFVVLTIILFAASIYCSFKDIFFTVLSAVILVFSLKNFFFPTSYRIENEGIKVRNIFPVKYNWEKFRRYQKFDRGIVLSTFDEPNRLDYYRSVVLYCQDDMREKVLHIIKEKIT